MLRNRYIIKQLFSYCTKNDLYGPEFMEKYLIKLRHDFSNGILVLMEDRRDFETEVERRLHTSIFSTS
jgi:hypothetical protein